MRESGFYWVRSKQTEGALYDGWAVVEYVKLKQPNRFNTSGVWVFGDTTVRDGFWGEIDERQIMRDKKCEDKSLEFNRLFIVDKKNKIVGTIYYDKID